MTALTFGLSLIRHGETQYNKEGLLQGQAIDSALSDIGLQQAEAAGCYLKDVEFSNVFASDMLRARQTAETIMKHNRSCSGVQMVCDPLLKEKSFGIAEGQRVQDVREMAKAAGQTFPDFTPPNGETREQILAWTLTLVHPSDQHITMMMQIYKDGFDVSSKRSPISVGYMPPSQLFLDQLQVKERVKEFLEKILQQIGAEHWHDRGEDETSVSAPSETSPVEGRADDGVRGVPVHALVVTHGAYMCVAVRFFVEELHCSVPPGSDEAHMFALSPNTGLCRFLLTVRKEDDRFTLSGIRCVFVHRGGHVKK